MFTLITGITPDNGAGRGDEEIDAQEPGAEETVMTEGLEDGEDGQVIHGEDGDGQAILNKEGDEQVIHDDVDQIVESLEHNEEKDKDKEDEGDDVDMETMLLEAKLESDLKKQGE